MSSRSVATSPLHTEAELAALSREILRVGPGGLYVYAVRNTRDADFQRGIHRGEDLYENQGFIVHFFDRAKIERLAGGYEIISVDEFDEGRRLIEMFSRADPRRLRGSKPLVGLTLPRRKTRPTMTTSSHLGPSPPARRHRRRQLVAHNKRQPRYTRAVNDRAKLKQKRRGLS